VVAAGQARRGARRQAAGQELREILEDAIEDGHLDRNGARGRRMRVRVSKPDRTFLEMDELACLLDAAAAQDRRIDTDREGGVLPLKAAIVAQRFAQGETPRQIAQALGLSKSTVSYHLRRAGANVGRGYIGRKIVCEILGRSGVRVSELCELKIGQLRLHDPDGAHFNIPDVKTHTGIREVQMTPDLVEAVIEHIDLLRRCGRPTGPDNYLAQNTGGGQMSRQRAGEIVRDAATQASRELAGKGLAPLPRTTPHSLRRTYISIVLLANNFDVKWVMSQVGHARLEDDPRRLRPAGAARRPQPRRELRRPRAQGPRPLRRATRAASGARWHVVATGWTRRRETNQDRRQTPPPRTLKERRFAASSWHGETGTRTRDTTIFSLVILRLKTP
jgi:integrase